MQNFFSLGLSLIFNGVGRFVAIFLMLFFFRARSTEALIGALIGLASAVAAAFWPSRKLFLPLPGKFAWISWFKRAIPLAGGAGATAVARVLHAEEC